MKLASNKVLKFSIGRSIYICQSINVRIDTSPAIFLADNEVKVEYEFVVIIEFEEEARDG